MTIIQCHVLAIIMQVTHTNIPNAKAEGRENGLIISSLKYITCPITIILSCYAMNFACSLYYPCTCTCYNRMLQNTNSCVHNRKDCRRTDGVRDEFLQSNSLGGSSGSSWLCSAWSEDGLLPNEERRICLFQHSLPDTYLIHTYWHLLDPILLLNMMSYHPYYCTMLSLPLHS